MARTRAAKGGAASTAKQPPALKKTESRYSLPEEMAHPPQLFILPKVASQEARVVTLQNPRYSKPTRYLVCPETGVYEFTKIAAPSSTPRSWLIERAIISQKDSHGAEETSTPQGFETHITKEAELFVASPYDPLFLVLPALTCDTGAKSGKRMFLSSDDHVDSISESSPHLPLVMRWGKIRAIVEARMASVCDTVEAGDETMFRLNEDKLLEEMVSKARRMSDGGLPKSMEDKFVTKPLEAPVLTRRNLQQPTLSSESTTEEGAETPKTEAAESQASISSVETTDSSTTQASTSTTATSVDDQVTEENIAAAMTASDEVLKLQRLRVAFNFILSSYINPKLASTLNKNLVCAPKAADFSPLEDYLAQLAKLKQEVFASRAATDYSRKRGLEEENDERAEKRRKKEEEERKKKAGESRGVRDLKKVNVSGMKKLTSFFTKK